MAERKEVEEEYESELEDAPLPTMRRRAAASDDEEDEDGGGPLPSSRRAGSDADSDGQGAAEVYDDDGEEAYYDDEEEVYEEAEEYEELEQGGRRGGEGDGVEQIEAAAEKGTVSEAPGSEQKGDEFGEKAEAVVEGDEGKKENEPYAVPTVGAFYMHDDRFQENGRRHQRRMFGGRKLWNPKDERAWVHDRFDEMNLQDSQQYDEKRKPKGCFRGRGSSRTRGTERGYFLGNRSRAYCDGGKNQNSAPKVVRGRGSRRYQPRWKSVSEMSSSQNIMPQKSHEPSSNASMGKQTSNLQPESALPKKQIFASNLNSASPPFYPSGSSHREFSTVQRRDSQTGSAGKPLSSSVQLGASYRKPHSGPLLRGKVVVTSGHGRLHVEDSFQTVAIKSMASSPLHSPVFNTSSNSPGQPSISRGQGRGLHIGGSPNDQFAAATHEVAKVSARTQNPAVQQRSVQAPVQSAPRMPAQMVGVQFAGGNQTPCPSQPTLVNLDEDGGTSSPGSIKSKAPTAVKGKDTTQGTERGSFLYGGAHVLGTNGAMGLALGDQGFPGTPALLPVMQFGGQHPGGPGVPTVGMALPGYVAQQQLGLGNSEMTWLPVLAGAAGALEASYCLPYITLDGRYYARPSGQASSSLSSRETSATKGPGSFKSGQIHEVVNDELGQRQNKPRRYSEMNFGQ